MVSRKTAVGILGLIGLAILPGWNCAEKPTIEEFLQTSIVGKVTSAENGAAVAGASISTQPVTTNVTTDEAGWFEIIIRDLISNQNFLVVVEKNGYLRK